MTDLERQRPGGGVSHHVILHAKNKFKHIEKSERAGTRTQGQSCVESIHIKAIILWAQRVFAAAVIICFGAPVAGHKSISPRILV